MCVEGKSLTDGQKWSSGEAFSINPRLSEDALFRGKTSCFALTPEKLIRNRSAFQKREKSFRIYRNMLKSGMDPAILLHRYKNQDNWG